MEGRFSHLAPLAPKYKLIPILSLVVLIALSIPLRFVDLGYSDYIGDERKAFIQPDPDQNILEFFLTRRKGPMQFIVSEIPYLITRDFRNELAQRIPYASISILAVCAFFLLIRKLTKSNLTAFLASLLYLANGFIVGFGRIAQYQNLNLLFNFLSLYFYSDLLYRERRLIRSTLMGTLFFCLSILSHWDAIFIIPLIFLFFITFLKNKDFSSFYKKRLLVYNFILGCLLLLPFLLPYIFVYSGHTDNQEYFLRRVEIGLHNPNLYIDLFRLYNPFIVLEFLALFSLISILWVRKLYPYLLWFLFGFAVFELFVRKPGTHIYNFVLPLFVLSGYSIANILKIAPKLLKFVITVSLCILYCFFYYQAYFIFINHYKEYPWQVKQYFPELAIKHKSDSIGKFLSGLRTPIYGIEDKLPLFGFPHKRDWNEINDTVNKQNSSLNEDFGYITNEDKTISEWYMDAKHRADNGFYIIVIKNPVNFVADSTYPQYPKKTKIAQFMNGTEWYVRIYRVEKGDNEK